MVTVVPLSAAVEMLTVGPTQTEGSAVVQSQVSPGRQVAGGTAGLACPAGQAGIELVAVKASVAGLYNSAECNAACPIGEPIAPGAMAGRLR